MDSRIQSRAKRYADAVAESVRATMREHGLPELDDGPITVAQLATLGEQLHIDPCEWFPMRASVLPAAS